MNLKLIEIVNSNEERRHFFFQIGYLKALINLKDMYVFEYFFTSAFEDLQTCLVGK